MLVGSGVVLLHERVSALMPVAGYTLLRVSFVLVDGDPREAAKKRKQKLKRSKLKPRQKLDVAKQSGPQRKRSS